MEQVPFQDVNKLKRLIADGKTEGAIEALLDYFENNHDYFLLYNELVLISSRYNEFKKSEIKGTNTNSNELNRINESLLKLIDLFENEYGSRKINLDNQISELRKKLLISEGEELDKAKFEAQQLQKQHPSSFEVHKLTLFSNTITSKSVKLLYTYRDYSPKMKNIKASLGRDIFSANSILPREGLKMPISLQIQLGVCFHKSKYQHLKLKFFTFPFTQSPRHQLPQYKFVHPENHQPQKHFL